MGLLEMARLEDLTPNASVRGILPNGLVTVVSVQWHGTAAVELTYKTPEGRVANELLFRHDEPRIEVATVGRPWSFDGEGDLFRLVSEAQRIRLAHLFDPVLAVHTSVVEPLPHQITAVYEAMLPRQPLRFLLADDPGAGKTIMAGLLMKELIARGDLQRCLVVCPGSLAEQWQDELYRRFHLPFEILTNDKLEAARTGNWFLENNLVIARLDKLSRDEDVQQKLQAPDCRWDLVVCDEAHKMSATFFGGEIKYTKRYRLGQLLSTLTRHFLLMSATPHNGKEEDFQLFMALLDGDRFEGRFRDGVHTADVSDLMRRMVKEKLLKFDGKPLFPERIAYTVTYTLSDAEAQLYKEVTDYVRQEFNRADALENDKRAGTVGFALTILQRRLASSPEAIYQSLRRRRERLESRMRELEVLQRGAEIGAVLSAGRMLDADDVDDLDDAPDNEVQAAEEEILDQATAARSIGELKIEIDTLKRLEALASSIRRSGEDRKWRELASLLSEIFTPTVIANGFAEEQAEYDAGGSDQHSPPPKPTASPHQKLVLFTEHRDTLNYLETRVSSLLGSREAVVSIHGGLGREERKKAEESFKHDPDVRVLLATDAAGEGINLQRAHLMVNYDLPWNPNRLEQRFGRIHRIGQTEMCHLWNLVAGETREGAVYQRLLEKLEEARKALGGKVYDVLGELFVERKLHDLLFEAVREGEREEIRAKLFEVVEGAVDQQRLKELTERAQLSAESLSPARVEELRLEMERAAAQRLQPHYIRAFFMEAFRRQGGILEPREQGRWEVTRVPARVRMHDHVAGSGDPVLERYHRVCFDKGFRKPSAQDADAALVAPGHPLLEATTDLTLEEFGPALREGAVLVDENDWGQTPKLLIMAEHEIRDGRMAADGTARIVSKQLQSVYLKPDGAAQIAGPAPYLDLRAARAEEQDVVSSLVEADWLTGDLNQRAVQFAARTLVPEHLERVRERRLSHLKKVEDEVRERLKREIRHWDARAAKHRQAVMQGKDETLALRKAETRANELGQRLEMRLAEIERERDIAALPPRVLGGALVVPIGLIQTRLAPTKVDGFAEETAEVELIAMQAVMDAERAAGRSPVDVSKFNRGWDIESFTPNGKMLFLEVKGRIVGGSDVIVTRNEMLKARNAGRQYHLVVVQVENGFARQPVYIADPAGHFWFEGEFRDTCRHYALKDLLAVANPLPDLGF